MKLGYIFDPPLFISLHSLHKRTDVSFCSLQPYFQHRNDFLLPWLSNNQKGHPPSKRNVLSTRSLCNNSIYLFDLHTFSGNMNSRDMSLYCSILPAGGAIHAPIFILSFMPKSTTLPVVIPSICTFPFSFNASLE